MLTLTVNEGWLKKPKDHKYEPVIVGPLGADIVRVGQIKYECKEWISGRNGQGHGRLPVTWSFDIFPAPDVTGLTSSPAVKPVFVISSGSADRIAHHLATSADKLVWDPGLAGTKPIFLFVHKLEFEYYKQKLAGVFAAHKRIRLIGWSGESLVGFGAVRAAVIQFAARMDPCPAQIAMVDQDVLYTPSVDLDENSKAERSVTERHGGTKVHKNPNLKAPTVPPTEQKIVGYGLSASNRVKPGYTPPPKPASTEARARKYLGSVSPTQQFMSISAPYTPERPNRIFPTYMVTGGEDMAPTRKYGHLEQVKVPNASGTKAPMLKSNVAVRKQTIAKIGFTEAEDSHIGFDEFAALRRETLKMLFTREGSIAVSFSHDGTTRATDGEVATYLVEKIAGKLGLTQGTLAYDQEKYRLSSCIVERILLRRLGEDKTVRALNKYTPPAPAPTGLNT